MSEEATLADGSRRRKAQYHGRAAKYGTFVDGDNKKIAMKNEW